MLYRSTRTDASPVSDTRALLEGLAPDGGLYVPTELPMLPASILDPGLSCSYAELALEVLSPYFPSFERKRLLSALDASAACFSTREVAPVIRAGDLRILELFHGPTLAFKDIALTLFGSLLGMAREVEGLREELVVLTATSGDTGKAALAGLSGVPGVRVVVYYPATGVSPIQRLQMLTHDANNTTVIGVRGTFDDAQRGVKKLFASASVRERLAAIGLVPSSANSINIGRLLPQMVYYISAWRALCLSGDLHPGEALDVVVPTGNFGDILAAWYAKMAGLPLGRLVVASNRNRVLADFFETGAYDRNRDFHLTESPSMDILVSSNLERLIFEASNRNPNRISSLMGDLSTRGAYTLDDTERAFLSDFHAGSADDADAALELGRVFAETGYLMDTHTAVAAAVRRRLVLLGELSPKALVISTASPFKFPAAVARAIGLLNPNMGIIGAGARTSSEAAVPDPADLDGVDELDLARALAIRAGLALPKAVSELGDKSILHTSIVDPAGMEEALFRFVQGDRP